MSSHHRPNLLVVEDHPETRYFFKVALDEDHNVHTAATAEAALDELQRASFDLLIVDIALGDGMSGVDLVSQLRAEPAYDTTPILAVTAHVRHDSRQYYLDNGFDGFLQKPFLVESLMATLAELIEGPSAISRSSC